MLYIDGSLHTYNFYLCQVKQKYLKEADSLHCRQAMRLLCL
jgi:hypothetical protein